MRDENDSKDNGSAANTDLKVLTQAGTGGASVITAVFKSLRPTGPQSQMSHGDRCQIGSENLWVLEHENGL
jgi:hypothetical protein